MAINRWIFDQSVGLLLHILFARLCYAITPHSFSFETITHNACFIIEFSTQKLPFRRIQLWRSIKGKHFIKYVHTAMGACVCVYVYIKWKRIFRDVQRMIHLGCSFHVDIFNTPFFGRQLTCRQFCISSFLFVKEIEEANIYYIMHKCRRKLGHFALVYIVYVAKTEIQVWKLC